MKSLIIYDSDFGNTKAVAQMIASSISEVRLVEVGKVRPIDLNGLDMLIVGSPTQGGRPTEAIRLFLAQLAAGSLRGVRVAAFDTRFGLNDHGFGLKVLMKTIGFAAEKMAHTLQAKGGRLVAAPAGFVVTDKQGPLGDGEQDRAKAWALSLV